MIKICISGFTSTGKTTLGESVSLRLGIPHINNSYKDIVGNGDALINLQRNVDKKFAQKFDSNVLKQAKKGDCVVTTWLSPWLVKDATVRIWLDSDMGERIKRTAKREKITKAMARSYIMEKDRTNMRNFKRDYGIDIMDHSIFDAVINSSRVSVDEITAIISIMALSKDKRNAR